jgi:hypothetical protein
MSAGDAVESISVFFNDLVGAVVPASVWALGIVVMHVGFGSVLSAPAFDGVAWPLFAVGVLFAAGHLLLAVYEPINWALVLVHAKMAKAVEAHPWLRQVGLEKLSTTICAYEEVAGSNRNSYILFAKAERSNSMLVLGENEEWLPRDLRSFAMTLSPAGEALGRRFMFIALLCRGTGTALVLLALQFSVVRLIAPESLYSYSVALPWWLQVGLLLGAAYLLFIRETTFFARAMATPFACAIAELSIPKFEKK